MDGMVGLRFGDWMRVLVRNRFHVSRKYLERAAFITQMSLLNSFGYRREMREYGEQFSKVIVPDPIFILGHWRSGTTLLHNTISSDPQFAYPNLFQVSHPHTMLVREKMVEKALGEAEAEKRPMDEIKISFRSPGEDEFGLAVLCQLSPIMAWMFPRNEAYYDRYLTFRDADPCETKRWQENLVLYMKKLTYRYQRTLILKSPPHTARIRLILECFPGARFIHIHRNPFNVYRSTQTLFATAVKQSYLQDPKPGQIDAGILRRYQQMYASFFEERSLIPAGHYIEICFEDLENDLYHQVAQIYEALCLPGFQEFEPELRKYVDSLGEYKKNKHPSIEPDLRDQIVRAWRQSFDEWHYPTS